MDLQTIVANIQNVLQEVSFPVNKGEVVEAAERNNMGDEVMQLVQKLPDQQFKDIKDVISQLPLGDIEESIEKFL